MRQGRERSSSAAKWKWRNSKGGKKAACHHGDPVYDDRGGNRQVFERCRANLVETKKTTDIVDISNQSSKEGIRIVLELKKGADVENLKNMLYKKTRLEDTFGVNMLAVADGRPETLGLKADHRASRGFPVRACNEKVYDPSGKRTGEERSPGGTDQGLRRDRPDHRDSARKQIGKRCQEPVWLNGETENIRFKSNISKKMAVHAAVYRASGHCHPGDASLPSDRTGDRGTPEGA